MARVPLMVLILGVLPVENARAQAAGGNAEDGLQLGEKDAPLLIDSVAFVSRNVFDPEEAATSFIFRVSNALHIRTRRYVVSRELLLHAGEPYDSLKADETERNLRSLGLFRDVSVDTIRQNGRLILRVDAADAWTTTLQADGRFSDGDFMWGIGLKEKNILGTGTLFRIKHRKEVDRNSFTLEASQNRFMGTRGGFLGRLDNLSDGSKGVWEVGVPFRAFSDRTALELPGEFANQRVLQFRDGVLYRESFRRLVRQNARIAIAPYASERGYLRLGLLGQIKREEFLSLADTGLSVPDTVTAAVGLSVDFVRARFIVTHYYLAFARDVDVDLSTRLTASAWVAPTIFGYDRTGVGPSADAQVGVALGESFARLEAHANGLFNGAGLDSGQVRGVLTAVTQAVPRSATVLRVEAGVRKGTPPAQEFDLGFGRGLRRFGAHAFTGTREVWGTAEQRAFLMDEFLGLVGIGVAGFVDYGGAWFPDQSARFGGSVGVGLRLSSTRAGAVTMGRFDVAYRFGDGFGNKRWALSFGRNVGF